MEIRKVLALRGPNIWARFPVLEAWVDLGPWKDTASNEVAGFNDRLMSWLPSMIEHRCSIGERGGFFERLRRGTYPAHIMEHTCLELQSLAGTPVGFGKARETTQEGVYKVVVRYHEETLGRAALASARDLVLAALQGRDFDVEAEVKKLRDIAHEHCLGPSTAAIVGAARARGIPFKRLNEGSLIQLGWGWKQRRIWTAETSKTSAIAEGIAQDKELTRRLLAAIGVPVPEGRPVSDAEDAWAAAQEIEGPVVVKPQYGNQGRGVATNLTTREQVTAAYEAARLHGNAIVVERFAPGLDHRVLVVGNRVIAAARREPAHVIGDGNRTVRHLIEVVNRDPRRSDGHATALSQIKIDEIALGVLAEQGYTPDSIPAADERVLIRRNANLSTGGTAVDVTDQVHPDVAARAVETARMVGLDIAGVDIVCRDIGKPLDQQGGAIVEVNAGPGLRMHLEPSEGKPRPVGEAIIDMLFPPGDDGRIPVVAITGVNGKTTTTRLISHIVEGTGRKVGMTSTDGIYIGGRRIDDGDCSGPLSAQAALMHPMVEAGVFETARGGILRAGLGFDACDVSVVTNIGEGDHLGINDIDTLEKLASVKETVVYATRPGGTAVLKADDPMVSGMARLARGPVIFFAQDPEFPGIVEHRADGGRAVTVRNGAVILADGAEETVLIDLADVPLTLGGRIGFQVENVLAASGAAWALGIDLDTIRSSLETFTSEPHRVPGRFNVMESQGATVIIDYSHNPSAVIALGQALDTFPHQHRTIAFSAAGDRRDADILRQGELLGEIFDHVIVFEDCNRGRADGEVLDLLRRGAERGPRARTITEGPSNERESIVLALEGLRPGQLLVIQPDEIEKTVAFVQKWLAEHPLAAAGQSEPCMIPVTSARAAGVMPTPVLD
ncbi:MAG: cyanophycin synthetase [Isosphaeraceae bacterium]